MTALGNVDLEPLREFRSNIRIPVDTFFSAVRASSKFSPLLTVLCSCSMDFLISSLGDFEQSSATGGTAPLPFSTSKDGLSCAFENGAIIGNDVLDSRSFLSTRLSKNSLESIFASE